MATKNDRYYRTYVPMGETTDTSTGKTALEELEVEVYYSLGGHNHWTGGETARGIWLSLWPVRREKSSGGFESVTRSIPDDRARRMLLQPQKRRQDPHGMQWGDFIRNNLEDIASAGARQDWSAVAHVVTHRLKAA